MANEQKPAAASSRIKSMDTTKAAIKRDYLEPAAKKLGKSFHSGEVIKRAFIIFAADCAALTGEDRTKFCAQLDATPGWFPVNPSACRQAFEAKTEADAIAKDYSAW